MLDKVFISYLKLSSSFSNKTNEAIPPLLYNIAVFPPIVMSVGSIRSKPVSIMGTSSFSEKLQANNSQEKGTILIDDPSNTFL